MTRGVGGVEGVIDGLFGKSGKFKVHVAQASAPPNLHIK